ncbi:TIGR02147 family protein [Bdellovibrio sp. 22V]|uniref:TIGR02147 family protein n=1 Tax=Bdellovibrio sp. 22V TaxID=3044166 RepID=UPI0025430C7D|nr:TIGR02147 family protein [Bdellovibrio sp. 22V]WII72834.1 TIGR02147 family protein [Bdellovibrio sp. 22V]
MNVFDFHDYKHCVNAWIGEQPRNGHGQLRQLALYLDINSVVMSQIFRGERELTLEQALLVTRFIGLSELERDYFLLLVQKSRAGTVELKNVLEKQIANLKESALALKNRVKHQKFTDEDRATFYSQWYYSAVRLGVSIPQLNTAASIASYLNLDRVLVTKVVDFLLQHKLIVEHKGHLDMGPQVTHVGHDSPFVNRHHTNWRLKGMQAMERVSGKNLFYTGPMALSEESTQEVRKLLIELVEKTTKKAASSDSEVLRCLNIDWFAVGNER